MDGVDLHAEPVLHEPVLVVATEGWIDASAAASTAMSTMTEQMDIAPLATFDAEVFIDYRARRPTMHLRDGVNTGLTWPELTLAYGIDPVGKDLLVLRGPEPDMQWRAFCAHVTQLCSQFGVRMMVALGAYPIGVPHTRPVLVSCTASNSDLATSTGALRNSVDVPAGASAALEYSLSEAGIPTIGLWAQVPHYAAAMPFPAAAAALVEAANRVAGLAFDTSALHAAATTQRQRLDDLVAQSAEHVAMLRELEKAYDTVASTDLLSQPGTPLPSGDELAAELERYLRDQGNS